MLTVHLWHGSKSVAGLVDPYLHATVLHIGYLLLLRGGEFVPRFLRTDVNSTIPLTCGLSNFTVLTSVARLKAWAMDSASIW